MAGGAGAQEVSCGLEQPVTFVNNPLHGLPLTNRLIRTHGYRGLRLEGAGEGGRGHLLVLLVLATMERLYSERSADDARGVRRWVVAEDVVGGVGAGNRL